MHLLITPHRFPSLEREAAVAAAAGLELVVCADAAEYRSRLAGARAILLTPFVDVDAAAIAALDDCIAIVRYGVGVDNVDLAAATARGIAVANVPDAATDEVATHAVALALSLLRRLGETDAALRGGAWSLGTMVGVHRLSTRTVGIVGAGRIGRLTAAHFAALGARVLVHDPYGVPDGLVAATLDEVIAQSDIVSLHVPLTDGTRNLIAGERLAAMRPGAILINVSRGALIDEAAVAEALEAGRLGGLGLDVFAEEPLDRASRSSPRRARS